MAIRTDRDPAFSRQEFADFCRNKPAENWYDGRLSPSHTEIDMLPPKSDNDEKL